MTVKLAITMGDPCGIGPEIVIKAIDLLRHRLDAGELSLVVAGSSRLLGDAADRMQLPRIPDGHGSNVRIDEIDVPADTDLDTLTLGEVSPLAGRMAFQSIKRAVELASSGAVAGIVTAPLQKEALNLAGFHYAGHTEMLADLTGVSGSVMMLAHGAIRVSHVTTHVALADVPSRVTPERITRVVRLTVDALNALGIEKPRIAVAALNPHAGEGGIFGRQDIDVTTPTVESLRNEGLDVTGPVPGDTVFVKHRGGQFDAVVAMYHDQGHIPVKLLGFNVDPETGRWNALSGVNITLGLPIIRTSVDHGTAFDIAGKGIADPNSLVEAIEMAAQLALVRRQEVPA